MEHFRYIDHIRKPDGTLRDWKEHDILAKYECDLAVYVDNGHPRYKMEAQAIKAKEYERRGSLQKTLQDIR